LLQWFVRPYHQGHHEVEEVMVVGQVKQGKITYERFVPSLEHPVPRQICVSNMNVRL